MIFLGLDCKHVIIGFSFSDYDFYTLTIVNYSYNSTLILVHQHEDVVNVSYIVSISFDKVIRDQNVFQKRPHVLISLNKLGVNFTLAPIHLVMLHFHLILSYEFRQSVR